MRKSVWRIHADKFINFEVFMNTLHELYKYDSEYKIWTNAKAATFNYSDGEETEKSLYDSLLAVQDKSLFSPELVDLRKSWPFVYHLSPERANLLRPFEKFFNPRTRVLELGCGCGAISRYLAECGTRLYAVEGSKMRGHIAALRCADLENAQIIIDRIQDLPAALGKFDAVTLIGVLEYAARYVKDPNPWVSLLEKAASFLKPEGILILAIENRLGLKYLAGVPEDHLGYSWAGVMDNYDKWGIRTFARKQIISFLKDAGFKNFSQYIPLPDYKLTSSIITPTGLDYPLWNKGAFIAQKQRIFESLPLFNLCGAWQSVIDGDLLPELADSFLFVAHNIPHNSPLNVDSDTLAWHYGSSPYSNIKYAKAVSIKKVANNIFVERTALVPGEQTRDDEFFMEWKNEPYYQGETLIDRIRRLMSRPGWSEAEIAEALRPWFELLQKNMLADGKLPYNFLDATPFNLIIDDAGKCHFFDLEWCKNTTVHFSQVFIRGLLQTFFRIGSVGAPQSNVIPTYNYLASYILNYYGIVCDDQSIQLALEIDSLDYFLFNKHMQWGKIKNNKLSIMQINPEESFKSNEVISEYKAKIDGILNSRSWKLATAIRKIKKFLIKK